MIWLITLLVIGYLLLAYWVWFLIDRVDKLEQAAMDVDALLVVVIDKVFPNLLTDEQRQRFTTYLNQRYPQGENE